MSIALFWALALALFWIASELGRRLGLIPIVSQLLLATLGLPLLMLFWVEPHWQLSGAALVAPSWLKTLYGLSFALLLGHILADVVELEFDRQSLKIALPSFFVPFACGLACGALLLPEQPWLTTLALGLVFAITAIPVLYLYLRNIDYPPAATRRLMQSAILIDLTCWLLFGLGKGSLEPLSLLLPLLGACLPLPLFALGVRRPWVYSLGFFGLLFVAEHYCLNALIFGIGYLCCLAWLKLPLHMPLPPLWIKRLQNGIAIPLILTFGIIQIDIHNVLQGFDALQLSALLLLPIVSKLLGNWLGLCWATPSFAGASKWRESLLLNIRGLSEIVFLNLLLQQQLISPALYFALMLMSLVATLMPALAGLHRIPLKTAQPPRRPYAEH
ncbi:sodium:proton antiporter [Pseudomonas rubra]|uniref:Sodium:proton antiporter n=1 Tax=Pseudomonas rubra TaxID=2942627 RepID=A0ABT5P6S5_9PSED|nr:sodium:proton antiporter [Pseudomonas rubra]MDD1013991.1 sodium:proton antiporter [Pseudomonas rubra]MDD1038925.1 sodium:proton antiporter [Pseudomonas rubra]MDD1154321.1 sodium:proton antiporter [Pseudomonas rubra]